MIFRDEINLITQDRMSDGMGGFTVSESIHAPIKCKASFNTSPEVANSYGVANEQILYVATTEELAEGAFYSFKGKRYQVRFKNSTRRIFYSTLIAVKEEHNV